jgi:hypothetical protein
MELGAIFLLLLVLLIVVLFVSRPFSEHWRVKIQSSRERSALLAERERALNALQELDFDYGLGKVPAQEYATQRARHLLKGSEVLRRLDEIQSAELQPVPQQENTLVVAKQTSLLSDEDLEELIAKRRGERRQKTAGFCPKCGKPILQADQFCPTCGLMVYSK